VALTLVAGGGLWLDGRLETTLRTQLRSELETVLRGAVSALRLWAESHRTTVEDWARDPRIVTAIAALPQRDGANSVASEDLKGLLGTLVARRGYEGFLVLDSSGRILASDVRDRVGGVELAAVPFLSGVAERGSLVTRPVAGIQEAGSGGTARIYALATVEETDAILALTLAPRGSFGEVLEAARPGHTGETYAVDAEGRLASPSRFESDLRRAGLVEDEATVLRVEVRDPGVNLVEGFTSPSPRRAQPLTRMAAEVTAGRRGIDLEGYRDYRGVPVIGAWTWMPDLALGVTTEIDAAEAYAAIVALRRGMWAVVGLAVAGVLGLGLNSRVVAALERKVRRAERLGQYLVYEKIGQGGMGEVYRAQHALLRRPTAVKLLGAEAGAESVERFEREVRLTSALTHPNTIAIYDYGRTPDGVFYYAMEYLPGLDLERLVEEDGAQPAARVLHIIQQACGSLAEAHGRGLIHRDIKPANMMLCERGGALDYLKVLDFGLVKLQDEGGASLTQTGTIAGTPLYLSPEAIQFPDEVGPASDIYALGAVAYWLLTGKPVFEGSSVVEVCSHHLTRAPASPSDRLGRPLPADVERVVLGCLAKDPSERPGNADELLEALRACDDSGRWTQERAREWWARRPIPAPAADRGDAESVARTPSMILQARAQSGPPNPDD